MNNFNKLILNSLIISISLTWFDKFDFSGYSLSLIFGFLSGVFWLLKLLKKKRVHINSEFIFISMSMIILMFLSLLRYGFITGLGILYIRSFCLGLVFFVIIFDTIKDRNQWKKMIYSYAYVGGAVVIISVLFKVGSGGRITGLITPDPNYSAARIATLFPLLYMMFKNEKKLKIKVFTILSMFFSVIFIVLSYSRMGYLTLLLMVSLLVFYNFINRRGFKKIIFVYKLLILFLIILIFALPYLNFNNRIMIRFLSIFNREVGNKASQASVSNRLSLLISGLKMFFDNLLLGVGIGKFPVFAEKYGAHAPLVAHNTFLQIGAELGFLGISLFLTLFYLAYSYLKKKLKKFGDLKFNFYEISSLKTILWSYSFTLLFLTTFDLSIFMIFAFIFSHKSYLEGNL